jgi:DNA-binding SARP family transcriptional activator/pimeloyl-ACP methyl ester carboxylesterase/class 3 adenylate cyclase
MEFRLLGPVEVRDRGSVVPIAAGKERALLALLLLHANRTVTRERIIDDLWGEAPPSSARKMVQVYVSHLRKALPEQRLQTSAPGYVLKVERDEVDAERFERLAESGRRALASGDAGVAVDHLRGALALWRGEALVEFAEPFAQHEGARLEELRMATVEARIAAELELGSHAEVVGELEPLVAENPLRERLRELQMRALYGSGRQAEALSSFEKFRRTLDEELGIAPSPVLKDLQRRMLRQDPDLAPRDIAPPRRRAPRPAADAAATGGEVGYARSGDVRIAYQLVGDGPLDLILVHGWVCTFQPAWENPKLASFYRRLASLGRLILFDKRGTGLSDRVSPERLPDLETRMDDVRAVMDAVGSERALVLGVSEGGAMSALFAATYPERTIGLVLMGAFARMMRAPDYPIGLTENAYQRRLAVLDDEDWARQTTVEWLSRVGPDLLDDEIRWYTSYLMRGASPSASRAIRVMNREIDVRAVISTIAVPSLVVYRADEYMSERTRYLGERIPGAELVELPGNDHLPWEGDQDPLFSEIDRFVSGLRADIASDRVLATLLFTDIVGSTATAAKLGDERWKALLAQHNGIVRAQLARFRGREIDTTGDGMLATFDGPARAVRCAATIVRSIREIGLEVRTGVHTGEIQQTDSGVAGIAVHIAARVMAEALPSEVLVSSTVKDIVAGSGIAFEERGERELKGVPDRVRLYAATP